MLNEDQIFELDAVGMLIFSIKGFNILRINEKAANIYEYQKAHLEGKQLSTILGKKQIEWLKRLVDKSNTLTAHGATVQSYKIKTGQTRHVRIKLNAMGKQNSHLALFTFLDITDDILKNRRISRQDSFLRIINDFNSALRRGTTYQQWFKDNISLLVRVLNIQEVEYLKVYTANSKGNEYQLERKFALDGKSENWPWPNLHQHEADDLLTSLQQNKPISLLTNRLEPNNQLNQYLIDRGGKTYLFVPVCLDQKFIGFLCLEDGKDSRTWEKDELDFLSALADNLELHLENYEQRRKVEESEKKFKELVQGGADLIAIIDEQANYTYASPSVKNNLGFSAEYFEGKNALEFIHPDDQEWVASFLKKLEHQTSVTIPPYRFKNAHGQWSYLTTILIDKRNHPQIAGFIANSQNITEVINVRKDLELANERYALAAKASSDHIYDWNLETNEVERLGRSFQILLGYNQEDININKQAFWQSHIHPQDVERVYNELEECLSDPAVINCTARYRFKKSDGEYCELLDQAFIIRTSTGKAIRMIGAVKDISSIVQHEAEENLYLKIANGFSNKFDLIKCLDETVKLLVSNTKAAGAEIWLVSTDQKHLNLIQKFDSPALSGLYEDHKHISQFEKGMGVPGKVWKEGKTVFIDDLENSNVFDCKQAAVNTGLNSVIAIPIKRESEFVGVLTLLISKGYNSIIENIHILENIGLRLGSLISQKLLEDDLNNFFNLSPDYLCILGTDGVLKKVNKAIVDNTSYSERELLSKPLRDFIHPADRERGMKQIESALHSNELIYESTRFITKQGNAIHLTWSSRMDPKKKQVYAVAKDITLRIQARDELNLVNNRLRQAQKIAKLGYWSQPLDEKNFWWSEQLYNIFEVLPDRFKPNLRNVLKMVHPDDRTKVLKNRDTILTTGKELSYRHRIVSKSGNEKWVLQRLWLRRDETGKAVALEGTLQDISEQIENEEKLRISNERFQLAMTATREMIWDWDHNTNIITRGMGYESSIDYNASDKAGKNNSWFRMVHPDDIDEVWKSILAALDNTSQTKWEAEYRIIHRPNAISFVIDRGFIIRDVHGKPLRSVGSTLDVSETRKHLKAIERQNQALRDIAQMQSHEIRAPLARIMGLLELSKLEDINQESVQHYLHLMGESAHDLDRVIRDITAKTSELE